DANGILNVSALEKGTGKTQKITITNDKGRLSKDEIERMVNEAEKYKEDDEKEAARVQAKNGLESYAYSLKNTINDGELKDKISAEDKEKLSKAIDETTSWLDSSHSASTEEYTDKQKELESVANPIISGAYAASGGAGAGAGGMPGAGGFPGGAPGGGSAPGGASSSGPTVEEVD
ncbi:SSA3, partial [Candida oxycetoniae]